MSPLLVRAWLAFCVRRSQHNNREG